MKEAITTIIYAAPRVEVPEFLNVRKQFTLKYGAQFVEKAMVNHDLTVNDKVMFKLSVKVPEPYLCVQYLKQIAEENNIEWADSSGDSAPITGGYNNGMPPYGGQGDMGMHPYPSSQPVFPAQNYGPPPTVQSQQFHQTGTVPTNNYGTNTVGGGYGTSNFGSSNTMSAGMYSPSGTNQPQYDDHDSHAPPPPYISAAPTTSGYAVDFQPQIQHPLEHTLPNFSSENDIQYGSLSGDNANGEEYNFDELQKRFEALKSRE